MGNPVAHLATLASGTSVNAIWIKQLVALQATFTSGTHLYVRYFKIPKLRALLRAT